MARADDSGQGTPKDDSWGATTDSLTLPGGSGERGGIRRRFVVAISALVALVLTAQGAVIVLFGHRYLEDQIEGEAIAYSTLAVAPICDAYRKYYESGYSKFRELVSSTMRLEPDLEGLAIYDTEGTRKFQSSELTDRPSSADHLAPERLAVDDPLLAPVKGLEPVFWEARIEGHRHFVVVTPYVEEWGRHQYSVVFWVSYDSLQGAMVDIGWRVLGLALLALLLGVACAWVLSAQSLRPVEALTAGARRLARGDLAHRMELHSGDEFEILGATMDHMAALLSRTIHDLETSNEHLERLNRELQELDAVKSDLLANVSHELRTPLTAIRGYVEAMMAGLLGDLSDVQQDSLTVVERNIGRLRSMIDQLLSYSRMESGRMEVDLRPFDLGSTARHVVEAVAAARDAEERLHLEMPVELPEVFGDAGRIAQVLENLLTNALKFSPDDERVELHVRELPEGIEVQVRDQGIGIDADLHAKVFDRFFQVDAGSARHYGGMGLGLSIVREILEMHHARIEVDSAPGEGSTFRFVLPIASERTAFVPVGGGLRLVIIDDDASFVQRVSQALGELGWEVHAAATSSQGMALVQRVDPHAVVLDRLLPDRDGFELIAEIRAAPGLRDLPVVLCTIRRERALGMRLGASDYWVKPIDPLEMERRLATLLKQRQRAQETADPSADRLDGQSEGRETEEPA